MDELLKEIKKYADLTEQPLEKIIEQMTVLMIAINNNHKFCQRVGGSYFEVRVYFTPHGIADTLMARKIKENILKHIRPEQNN